MISRKEALARFLDTDVADVEENAYTPNRFNVGRKEYLVLSDDEADEASREAILDSLWAFQPSFILAHSNCELEEKYLEKIQGELCEGANALVKSLIRDKDHFVSDAIAADGRGHFLSGYDGEENALDNWYIYRQ